MSQNTEVRFELPDYVSVISESFDGQHVEITYDSNFGGSVTVDGTAELEEGRWPSEWNTLNVGDRKVRSNGHVFNSDDRHLGTVESVTATVDKDKAIELVTKHVDYDIDTGEDEIIVQTWDKSVIEEQGFIDGTDEIRMIQV